MLARVELYNSVNEWFLTLYMGDSTASPYIVKSIDGLGPVSASIFTSGYAGQDGEVYQSSKTGMRNVIFKLGYRTDSTLSISDRRKALYKYMSPKSRITMVFRDEFGVAVETTGFVETHEPVMFSQEPEVKISVLCPSGYFTSGVTVLDIPSNESVPIDYPGSANTGFLMSFTATQAMPYFQVLPLSQYANSNGIESQETMGYSGEILAGDKILISTVRGDKYLRRERGGVTTSILNGLIWSLTLSLGPNGQNAGLRTMHQGPSFPIRLEYTPKYSGI